MSPNRKSRSIAVIVSPSRLRVSLLPMPSLYQDSHGWEGQRSHEWELFQEKIPARIPIDGIPSGGYHSGMTTLAKRFAGNAKEVMKTNGKTIDDLVVNSVPQSTAYRILRGESVPTLETAENIADALGVSLNRLLRA